MLNGQAGGAIKEGAIKEGAIKEIDVLWITAGLGCDGDTIAMTAATQPSIEEIVLGALPWTPKVNPHNPFLALANGDDFLKPFHEAAEGKIENFILVLEGSVPTEHNKEEGYWASMGTDPKTGQPITTCEWMCRFQQSAERGLSTFADVAFFLQRFFGPLQIGDVKAHAMNEPGLSVPGRRSCHRK
jgi:hydrogenase small subunit